MFGWSVGWWLVVVLVGLLLVLCGWWSASDYKVASNYLVPLLRTWKGGGWELVAACCGFVGGLLAPWLGGWVENLGFPQVFLGFGEARPKGDIPLVSSGPPASGPVFFKVLGKNVIFV